VPLRRPLLSVAQILAWADTHRARTGDWPAVSSGAVIGAAGETWVYLEHALVTGYRGLPGGDSLARLLARHRGRRSQADLPLLTEAGIVRWARQHRWRTGRWPRRDSGRIDGSHGLPGGDSLSRMLARTCGKRHHLDLPLLTVAQILAWADGQRERTGRWPQNASGVVTGAPPGETWRGSTMPCGKDAGDCRGDRPWSACWPGTGACASSDCCRP
jgi:hypothetical protein